MTDPKRWSDDDAELDADERRLLHAGLRPSVPRGAKRAVWVALGVQLPAAAAAASTAGGSLTIVSLLKFAGIGVVLGTTTMGVVAVVRHVPAQPPPANVSVRTPAFDSSPSPPPNAVAPPLAPSELEPAPVPEQKGPSLRKPEELPPVVAAPPVPSEAAFPTDGAARAYDAENLRIRAARGLLQAGRTKEALVALEQIGRDLPNGELSQEREALSIQALRLLGRAGEARQRASLFLERYPRSPHAQTARRALE